MALFGGSRNWDKSPETKVDKKFHDLCASGWKGAIDQDGSKIEDLDKWMDEQLHGKRR